QPRLLPRPAGPLHAGGDAIGVRRAERAALLENPLFAVGHAEQLPAAIACDFIGARVAILPQLPRALGEADGQLALGVAGVALLLHLGGTGIGEERALRSLPLEVTIPTANEHERQPHGQRDGGNASHRTLPPFPCRTGPLPRRTR